MLRRWTHTSCTHIKTCTHNSYNTLLQWMKCYITT